MDTDERLDSPGFITRYHQAVATYQDQLAEQRKKKTSAAKRRSTLHAVG